MVQEFLTKLAEQTDARGYRLYLVGGSLRDEILSRPSKDIDLTTDAPVGVIKEAINASGADEMFVVGEKHGTIGAVVGSTTIDVTTFRNYDGSIQVDTQKHYDALREDLSRRDFTMNAMARNILTGEVVDPFQGRDDIKYKLILAVGRAEDRFDEDPLRILRAVRFAAQLNFKIDPVTYRAIKKMGHRLTEIATERLGDEMDKMLVTAHPGKYLELLDDLDLLRYIIPEMVEMKNMPKSPGRTNTYRYKDVFPHTLKVVEGVGQNLVLRWAALLHDIAKPRTITFSHNGVQFYGHDRVGADMARRILTRLHRPNHVIEPVVQLIAQHLYTHNYSNGWTDGAVRRFIRDTAPYTEELFELCNADITSKNKLLVGDIKNANTALKERCARLKAEEDVEKLSSPLDGNDLMAIFDAGAGSWIKDIKEYLLNLVLDGTLKQEDKEGAEKIARNLVDKGAVKPLPVPDVRK